MYTLHDMPTGPTDEFYWIFCVVNTYQLSTIKTRIIKLRLRFTKIDWTGAGHYLILLDVYIVLCQQIHFTMQNLCLLEYSAEVFRFHMHYCQCLAVPVELAVMGFVFRFAVVGVTEMILWLLCMIVSKSVWDL